MGTRFASGKYARAICDVCGGTYRLHELRETVIKGRLSGIKACPECWDPDHPQLHLGEMPIYDAQALREPRPDSAELPQVRAQICPVWIRAAATQTPYVTVQIS